MCFHILFVYPGIHPITMPKATYQVDCVPGEGQGDFCLKCLKCGGFRVFRVCGFDRRPRRARGSDRRGIAERGRTLGCVSGCNDL